MTFAQKLPAMVDSLVRTTLAAVEPAAAVERALGSSSASSQPIAAALAVGKAAAPMLDGLAQWLAGGTGGGQIAANALCVTTVGSRRPDPARSAFRAVTILTADHPIPTPANLAAAQHVAQWMQRTAQGEGGANGRIVVLLSGGASALLTLPVEGIDLNDVQRLTSALLRAGTPIEELNTVRKHIEQLKGGRLGALAQDRPIDVLILSDVIGDRVDVISSGPFSPDPTTYTDAVTVLQRRGLLDAAPRVRDFLLAGQRGEHPETLKPGDQRLAHIRTSIIAGNRTAAEGARAHFAQLGLPIAGFRTEVAGEARDVGRTLAHAAAAIGSPTGAIVWGGETTVTVRGDGTGGRNQELALAAAIELDASKNRSVCSFGTDGIDGMTNAAGAIVTSETLARARSLGIDAAEFLKRNDSHTFFSRLEAAGHPCLIRTGPTGTNVNDIMLGLRLPD